MGSKLTGDFYQLILEEIQAEYINQERLIKLGQEEQTLAEKLPELSIDRDKLQMKKEAKRRARIIVPGRRRGCRIL